MAKKKGPKKAHKTGKDEPQLDKEVMTIDQVAHYLQLHKQVVYRHVKNGNIPVSRIGATMRFKRSVIDAWLEESARRSIGRRADAERAATPESEEKFVWE